MRNRTPLLGPATEILRIDADVVARVSEKSKPKVAPTVPGGSAPLLTLALICAIFQFYVIPLGGFYLSLGLLSCYALALRMDVRDLLFLRTSQVFILLTLSQAASLAWSPTRLLGVREIIYDVPFLFVYLATRQVAKKNEQAILSALRVFCYACAVHSTFMIVMAVSPQIKEVFFSTPLAAIFINGNSLSGIASGQIVTTAFGTDKAPGFFINANVAAVWEATALWITIFVIRTRWSWALVLVAVLHAIAIVASGSKASAALLVVIPLMTTLVMFVFPAYGKPQRLVVAACGAVVLAGIPYIVFKYFSKLHFVQDSEHTFLTRSVMWTHAWNQFKLHPWLGQGFGGWTPSFAPLGYVYEFMGVQPNFPPHNSLIIVWSESGLPALLLTLLLMLLLFRDALKPRLVQAGVALSRCTFGAFLFIVIQAMGENYGVLGDVHIKVPLAVMLGWASSYERKKSRP